MRANPRLVGLRTWAVMGFDKFRIYYPATPKVLTVVRVLHGKRDTQAILQDE